MSIIELGCDLTYTIERDTGFLFQVAVVETEHQQIQQESLIVTPESDTENSVISVSGNRCHRFSLAPGTLTLRYQASVMMKQVFTPTEMLQEIRYSDLPIEVMPFLNPSRYCESDRLSQLSWDEFGQIAAGHGRVQAIADWVHEKLAYIPGSSNASTTACDVLLQRQGVCRDYAHLAITLCRALGIPARYVAGYAVDLEPPDFHGFFEAYLSDDWYLFDPTKLAPISGLVRIGIGRDAADVAFANLTGSASLQEKSVWARYQQDDDKNSKCAEDKAISTA